MFILFWSTIIVALIAVFWLYIFKKLNILDTPWKYKDLTRKTPVPKLMWIFLILSVIISIIIFLPTYWNFKEVRWLFIWAIFLWIIAIIDEIRWLSAKLRLLVQILVSIIWILSWAIITHFSLFWHIYTIPYYIWFILSLIWFILIINSFNWFDWINWMWSWISTIWFFSIALLIKFVILKNYNVSWEELTHLILILNLSLIMTGTSFIFTLIEYKPLWLIRDVGIMFLWYVLAFLSLLSWWKIWVLMIVLSLIIFDAFWVIINRLKNKKNPLKWDYTHFHHRLMKHWCRREEIRVFVWIWSLFFMIIVILQWINNFNKIIILAMIMIIFFWLHIYLYWIKKIPHWMWDKK